MFLQLDVWKIFSSKNKPFSSRTPFSCRDWLFCSQLETYSRSYPGKSTSNLWHEIKTSEKCGKIKKLMKTFFSKKFSIYSASTGVLTLIFSINEFWTHFVFKYFTKQIDQKKNLAKKKNQFVCAKLWNSWYFCKKKKFKQKYSFPYFHCYPRSNRNFP